MTLRQPEPLRENTTLIVAAANDAVALKLHVALQRRGRDTLHVDGAHAARLFDIRTDGSLTRVSPHVSLFIRASAFWFYDTATDADARFLADECYATLWAAARLSGAPVINRPRANGAVGSLTCGELASAASAQSEATREVYASGPEQLRDPSAEWWGEDTESRVAAVADLRSGVPLRARRVNPHAAYEIVTVLGARAFAATTDASSRRFELLERSVLLARSVGVHFATIWWAVDDTAALPVRLNTSPEEAELRYCWQELVEPLCQDLRV
jgi:hypothetical protein